MKNKERIAGFKFLISFFYDSFSEKGSLKNCLALHRNMQAQRTALCSSIHLAFLKHSSK